MAAAGGSEKKMCDVACDIINDLHMKKEKRNIWEDSRWKHIAELENDDVGKAGEKMVDTFCRLAGVEASIDGMKTKERGGGGNGDGTIYGKSVEIKTARQGSGSTSFQHELGENPWNADYMLFLDISPDKMYLTVFPNFNKEFYEESGRNCKCKCEPYFPSKSITWRKQKGAFKLDTTVAINVANSLKNLTFVFDNFTSDGFEKFKSYIDSVFGVET